LTIWVDTWELARANVEEPSVRHRLNTRLRRLAVTLALAAAGTMTFGAMGGCDNEGEGERCTFFMGGDAAVNGTSECSAGLICTTAYFSNPNIVTGSPGNGSLGVCCPPAGTASTAAACQKSNGGSTTIGPPTGDGSFDAGPEAGDALAPNDAHGDATLDASTRDATQDSADATKDATTGG
jgi:hypothetical protein